MNYLKNIYRKDAVVSLVLIVVIFFFTGLGYYMNSWLFNAAGFAFVGAVLFISIISVYRKLIAVYGDANLSTQNLLSHLIDVEKSKANSIYLSMLSYLLEIKDPLPEMGDSAVSADLAYTLSTHIISTKPKLVIECGSGVSTLIIALALKRNGGGKVLALEHEKKYFNSTKALIKRSKLDKYADVVYSPLVHYSVEGYDLLWYKMPSTLKKNSIDALFVDGPPGYIQKLSRLPALFLLEKFMSRNYSILLDDTNREDEQVIIDIWTRKYQLDAQKINAEKGAVFLWGKK